MSASRVPLVASGELKQSWRNRSQSVDAAALEKSLRQVISGEVRFGVAAAHATSCSGRSPGSGTSAGGRPCPPSLHACHARPSRP